MNMDSWMGLIGGKKGTGARGRALQHGLECHAANPCKDWRTCGLTLLVAVTGIPMRDSGLPDRLKIFAERFRTPRHGRYAAAPAVADEAGIVTLPPAPFDPVPLATAAALLATGIALGSGYLEEQLRD